MLGMVNLLPPKEKKALRLEYRLRLATVALALLAGAVAMGAISLLPSLFIARAQSEELRTDEFLLQQDIESQKGGNASPLLAAANAKLAALAAPQSSKTAPEVFALVIAARPRGVVLTEFQFERHDATRALLRIEGVAPRRGNIIEFTRKLQEEKSFSDISFPISDLAKEEIVSFSVSLTVTL